jgi:methionine-rich copper-binding protein CopC
MINRPRLRAALALALLALVCLPGLALGHAELVSSDPPDGGTITLPYGLVAAFSEDLAADGSRIVVRDAANNEVARGGVEDDPRVMAVDLDGLEPGSYRARWTAVTPADNGITRGDIRFTIAAAASPSPSPTVAPSESPTGATTGSPLPTAPATATPTTAATASPSPTPTDGVPPAAGTADLLIAVGVAGALVGGLVLFLWRRRSA